MSLKDLDNAFNLIEKNKESFDFEKDFKSPSLINKAEEFLGQKFPETYKIFLERYGCGGTDGLEIYGLIDENFKNSGIPDVVWINMHERSKGWIPSHLIKISDAGDGFYYYLDASQENEEGEYPVVLWGHGMSESQKKIVNKDFGEFLLEQIQQSLEVDEE